MNCLACCTAKSYELSKIHNFLESEGYSVQYFRNVLYVKHPTQLGEAFFFSQGCFVTWNLSPHEEIRWCEEINQFSSEVLSSPEKHAFIYRLGNKTTIESSPEGSFDIITLAEDSADATLLKLAFSYGLSHSVKLRSNELSIQKIVTKNQPITQELADFGRISLSRKAIFKRMGEIFLAKSLVNLSNQYLDASEFFWRYPHLEQHHVMIEKFLDISKRVAILNQRLDIVHDVVLMLNHQLEHRHSSVLEIIIIVLILGELMMNGLSHYFKL